MQQIEHVSGEQISQVIRDRLEEGVVVQTDGWRAYRILNNDQYTHEPVVVRFGPNAVNALPWVHTLIANTKGDIRGVYHGVSRKHLDPYLAEFCYRFNRRFWESHMFDRILAACAATNTICYSGLKV